LTPNQTSRVQEIFTPSKIKDLAKGIQNERRQRLVIISLQDKIDSLKTVAFSKDKIISKYGNEIIHLNEQLRKTNDEENEVADIQLKDAKKPFLGLHLYTRAVVQNFEPSTINFSATLSYDLKKFSVGMAAWSTSMSNDAGNTFKSTMFYGPFVEYKIF